MLGGSPRSATPSTATTTSSTPDTSSSAGDGMLSPSTPPLPPPDTRQIADHGAAFAELTSAAAAAAHAVAAETSFSRSDADDPPIDVQPQPMFSDDSERSRTIIVPTPVVAAAAATLNATMTSPAQQPLMFAAAHVPPASPTSPSAAAAAIGTTSPSFPRQQPVAVPAGMGGTQSVAEVSGVLLRDHEDRQAGSLRAIDFARTTSNAVLTSRVVSDRDARRAVVAIIDPAAAALSDGPLAAAASGSYRGGQGRLPQDLRSMAGFAASAAVGGATHNSGGLFEVSSTTVVLGEPTNAEATSIPSLCSFPPEEPFRPSAGGVEPQIVLMRPGADRRISGDMPSFAMVHAEQQFFLSEE